MKLNLLKTEQDFGRFRNSRSFQGSTLRLRIVSSLNQNTPRFGFIVPKKVLPHAVDRNKIKRRLKAILTKHQVKLKSVDVLFFPTSKALKQTFAALETEVRQLFIKANLWNS